MTGSTKSLASFCCEYICGDQNSAISIFSIIGFISFFIAGMYTEIQQCYKYSGYSWEKCTATSVRVVYPRLSSAEGFVNFTTSNNCSYENIILFQCNDPDCVASNLQTFNNSWNCVFADVHNCLEIPAMNLDEKCTVALILLILSGICFSSILILFICACSGYYDSQSNSSSIQPIV